MNPSCSGFLLGLPVLPPEFWVGGIDPNPGVELSLCDFLCCQDTFPSFQSPPISVSSRRVNPNPHLGLSCHPHLVGSGQLHGCRAANKHQVCIWKFNASPLLPGILGLNPSKCTELHLVSIQHFGFGHSETLNPSSCSSLDYSRIRNLAFGCEH